MPTTTQVNNEGVYSLILRFYYTNRSRRSRRRRPGDTRRGRLSRGGQRSLNRCCDRGDAPPVRPDRHPGAAHFLRREAAPFLLLQSANSDTKSVTSARWVVVKPIRREQPCFSAASPSSGHSRVYNLNLYWCIYILINFHRNQRHIL